MAKETNWHKHVAIGTYIIIFLTLILIGLAILTFVRPPDPAHPMSFDFLSLAITIPLWLIGFVVLALVGTIFALVLWARRQVTHITKTIDLASLNIIDLPGPRLSVPSDRPETKTLADTKPATTPMSKFSINPRWWGMGSVPSQCNHLRGRYVLLYKGLRPGGTPSQHVRVPVPGYD